MKSRTKNKLKKSNPALKLLAPQRAAVSERRILISELINMMSEYMDQESIDTIYNAYLFGADAHEGQTRRSGEAYIFHPIAVARVLAGWRMDSRTIIAAILHDVIEDTEVSRKQIEEKFGEDVAYLVDGVSKISQLEEASREKAEAESFRKMIMAMAKDIRVILIKLADRLHNMRTLESLADDKKSRIAQQTLDLYAPIANRLGMHSLTRELEDLGFKNLYPKRYNAIMQEIKNKTRGRKPVVDNICLTFEQRLQEADIKCTVEGRQKNVFSIYRKMKRKNLTMNGIQDIFAVRAVVDDQNDCYRTLGVIHSLYKPRPASFKDYIAIPKTNGYQALHTVVFGPYAQPVEIQIRSQEMHRLAETGVASHWLYKTDKDGKSAPQQLAKKWLHSFIESQGKVGDSGEFMEYLKTDLFPDKVYVFTPKGDIKRLPRGATALDFAYSVHSDVGDHCIGARINQQMVPLHERLHNGDHIEVITSRSARPIPQWLDYAVTSKARSSIRQFLNKQKKREAVRLGRKLFKKALSDLGYRRLRIPSSDKVRLLTQLQLHDWPQLLHDIGLGKRLPGLVARQFLPDADHEKDLHKEKAALEIQGTEQMLVTYANCCHPVPGDMIVGYIAYGRGLVVHRTGCPNYQELSKTPDKLLPIAWSDSIKGHFQVGLQLETHNKPGILARLSQIIAKQKSNVIHLSVKEMDQNHSSMSFVIEVKDRTHLASIIRPLHSDNSVIKLTRD